MKINSGEGLFGQPGGEVTVENPDGVTKTYGSRSPNSLMNSGWAHGGPDGCGYGAFPRDEDDLSAGVMSHDPDRFRIG